MRFDDIYNRNRLKQANGDLSKKTLTSDSIHEVKMINRIRFYLDRLLYTLKWKLILPVLVKCGVPSDRADKLVRLPKKARGKIYKSGKVSISGAEVSQAAPRKKKNNIDSNSYMYANLKGHIKLLKSKGDLTLAIKALDDLYKLSNNKALLSELKNLRGVKKELDTRWLPRMSGKSSFSGKDNKRWKICHLNKVSYPEESTGGAVRNLNIMVSQKELGLEPFSVLPLGYASSVGSGVHVKEVDTSTTKGIKSYRTNPRGIDSIKLSRDVALELDTLWTSKYLEEEKPILIHANSGYRGYELALKGLALKKHFNIPMVYETRSLHEHTWGPFFDGIMEAEHTRLRVEQENRCMREADHVVVISESMKELMINRGIEKDKITVVPNGINTERYKNRVPTNGEKIRKRLGLNDTINIGIVSNISWREGHSITVSALEVLADDYPQLNCIFVGDGPLSSELRESVQKKGLGKRVHFLGQVDNSEIDEYYEAIDIFIIPRKADYAADYVTPLKPYEAMALKRPLIVSNRPALSEIVGKEERGLVFETDDHEDLAEKIKFYIENQEVRESIINNAYRWVFSERSWKSNANRYLSVYEKILPVEIFSCLPKLLSEKDF